MNGPSAPMEGSRANLNAPSLATRVVVLEPLKSVNKTSNQ